MAGKTPVIFNKFNVAKMSLKNLLFLKIGGIFEINTQDIVFWRFRINYIQCWL